MIDYDSDNSDNDGHKGESDNTLHYNYNLYNAF